MFTHFIFLLTFLPFSFLSFFSYIILFRTILPSFIFHFPFFISYLYFFSSCNLLLSLLSFSYNLPVCLSHLLPSLFHHSFFLHSFFLYIPLFISAALCFNFIILFFLAFRYLYEYISFPYILSPVSPLPLNIISIILFSLLFSSYRTTSFYFLILSDVYIILKFTISLPPYFLCFLKPLLHISCPALLPQMAPLTHIASSSPP